MRATAFLATLLVIATPSGGTAHVISTAHDVDEEGRTPHRLCHTSGWSGEAPVSLRPCVRLEQGTQWTWQLDLMAPGDAQALDVVVTWEPEWDVNTLMEVSLGARIDGGFSIIERFVGPSPLVLELDLESLEAPYISFTSLATEPACSDAGCTAWHYSQSFTFTGTLWTDSQ